jgi:hypothetical protein
MGKARAKGDDKASHQIRVNADLGEMIAWIVRVEETTTAQLLDPMLRAQIVARYKKIEAAVEEIKAAEQALAKVEEEAKASLQEKDEKGRKKRSD